MGLCCTHSLCTANSARAFDWHICVLLCLCAGIIYFGLLVVVFGDMQERTVPSRTCSMLPEDVASTVSIANNSDDGNHSFDLTFREVLYDAHPYHFVAMCCELQLYCTEFQGRRAIVITICGVAESEGAKQMAAALIKWPLMNKAMQQVRHCYCVVVCYLCRLVRSVRHHF